MAQAPVARPQPAAAAAAAPALPLGLPICCDHCEKRTRDVACYDRHAEEWDWNTCMKAHGFTKQGQLIRCFTCCPAIQTVLVEDLPLRCRARHGIAPPVDRLHGIHHLLPELDDALFAFWMLRPVAEWFHPTTRGSYPNSSPTVWRGDAESSRLFARVDFYRPRMDWQNVDWDELTRHMPKVLKSPQILGYARPAARASWMECMTGLAFHARYHSRFLPPGNALRITSPSTDETTLRFLLTGISELLCRVGVPADLGQGHCLALEA